MFDPAAKSINTHLCFPSLPNDHSDSGVCSPTLWRTTPPKSPRHRPEDYRCLSPDSKAQAIARGQQELMDMVSKMPESCFELSLKDIVEVKRNEDNDRKVFDELPKRTNMVMRKVKSDKMVDLNRNCGVNDSGFLLKMMFPLSLGSKKHTTKKKLKTKKKDSVTIKDCQVSPRPSISDETVKVEEKEWWNRLSESKGSGSTKSSVSSRSNSSIKSRSSRREDNSSCLSFFRSLRSQD